MAEEVSRSVPDRISDNDPSEDERAITRFRLLRPFLEDGVPLASVARAAKVPLSTAHRWVRRYRAQGLDGLARRPRADKGTRRVLLTRLQELIEGLALQKPRRSIAGIRRTVVEAAKKRAKALCRAQPRSPPWSTASTRTLPSCSLAGRQAAEPFEPASQGETEEPQRNVAGRSHPARHRGDG